MTEQMHTPETSPLPFELIDGNEHHGPYIVNAYGATVCDLYAMSNPLSLSVRNGGDSKPIWHANAAGNGALLVAAVNSFERIAQLEAELEFAAMRIENAAIHMKIVTDQIGESTDGAMPASIVKWTVNQLLKGQTEAAEAVARTRAAAPERIVGAAK